MFVCSSHNFIDSEVDDDCCQDETMEWDNNYNYKPTASTTVTQVRRTEAMLMLLGLEDVRYAHSDCECEDDGYANSRS